MNLPVNLADPAIKRPAQIAKALAHPARIAILQTLARQNSCFCGDLTNILPLAQSTVSQHLKALKEAGLIRGQIDGVHTCYCLEPAGVAELKTLLLSLSEELTATCCETPDLQPKLQPELHPNVQANLQPELQSNLQTYLQPMLQSIQINPDIISNTRKQDLLSVAAYIRDAIGKRGEAHLNFICTHNSRRSHLSQIWAAVAAYHYGLEGIHTYSGGTETTAFHPNAVDALRRAGFQISIVGLMGEPNPHYALEYTPNQPPMVCYSKRFDQAVPPGKPFAAIMTCSDADQNCPFVPTAEFRQSLPYDDPKQADGTAMETQVYDERSRQIASEMMWMMQAVTGSHPE